MKTNTSRFIMAGVVALALAANTHAATGPYLSMDLGLALVEDIEESSGGITATLETDPGVRFSLSPGYTFYSENGINFAFQAEAAIIYNSLDRASVSGIGSASVDGEFIQVPVIASLVFTFEPNPDWAFYAGVGGGAIYSRLEIDRVGGTPLDFSGDEIDPAFQAMAGIQYKIDGEQSIGIGYKFLHTFADDVDDIRTHSISLIYTKHF